MISEQTSSDDREPWLWRGAQAADEAAIVAMSLALHAEDPGTGRVDRAQVARTLATFRVQPHRGRAVVAEVSGELSAYALLVPFWSNEFGGLLCEIDELFVRPDRRGRGLASALFSALARGELCEPGSIGASLMTTDANERARSFYRRLGFERVGSVMVRVSHDRLRASTGA